MALSSTQIGAIAENVVANELLVESKGRLSPFRPLADDDGIDVLVFDKNTGDAVSLQVKARTKTLGGGKGVHFEIRKSSLRATRDGILLCVLLGDSLRIVDRAWLFPFAEVPKLAADRGNKYVLRPSKDVGSKDRYRAYQCESMADVAQRLIERFERRA